MLLVLGAMVIIKRNARPVFRTGLTPVRWLGRFLFRKIVVQLYRAFFFVRRHFGRVYMPAKNRLVYLLSNRYAIHFAIVAVVAIVSTVNFSGNEVRAENFGERSILYAMVTQDDSYVVQEVSAEEIREPEPSNYLGEGVLESEAQFVDEGYVNSLPVTIGSGAFVAPTISESDESVAPRTEVEKYVVQSGDTASGIAEQFGITTSTLLWANNLNAWSYIRPGDELNIPPVSGVLHTVASGDTLNKIANTYEADTQKILAFNKLSDADDLVVGETIIVPDGVKKTVVPSTATTYSSTASSSSSSGSSSYSGTYSGGTSGWVWPSDWRVITQYYGWRHAGLDIDCDYHVPNYAANNGVVTRSGWVSGYGLFVEIDHGGGIKTRYGHFSSLSVSAGQTVYAGQKLGMCGTTGRSTGTHLHFEVIVNGRTRNPLEYIR